MDKYISLEKREEKAVRQSYMREGAFVDLLNQEMKELQYNMKQKQIEEMANVMLVNMKRPKCFTSATEEQEFMNAYKFGFIGYATHFYNAGCRIMNENAVVLTREEYEWLTCCFGKFEEIMNDIKEQAGKETAEKFSERLKGSEMIKRIVNDGWIVSYVELCKEIDEICKELTEGEQGKLDEQKNCIYEQRKELDLVWWECSACGSGFNFYANTPYENRFHYCPYCGAKIAECKELQNERND